MWRQLFPAMILAWSLGCGGSDGGGAAWSETRIGAGAVGAFIVTDAGVMAVVDGRRVVRFADGEADLRFDAGDGGAVSPLALGGNEVFFLAREGDTTKLRAVPLKGGKARVLVPELAAYAGSGRPVAVEANDVFFIDGDTVRRVPIALGEPVAIAQGGATTLWTTRAHLYVGGPGVRRVPLTGGTPEMLIPSIPAQCGVVAGSQVLAGDGAGADGAIHAVDLDAGPAAGVARLRGLGCPIALRAGDVIATGARGLMTFAPQGGAPQATLPLREPPVSLVADREHLYVSDQSGSLTRYDIP